jgi:phosphatidylinositol 4-kinase
MVASWKSKNVPDKSLRENTRLAWEISPALCVFLPVRLKNADCIVKEVCRMVRANPMVVSHIPEALQYLVTTETLLSDAPEVCENYTLFYNLYFIQLFLMF